MKPFLFALAAFLLAGSTIPLLRAEPEPRREWRDGRWVIAPRGVTQYLVGQRRNVHDTIRKILHVSPERMARDWEWESWDRERPIETRQRRNRHGAQRAAEQPTVWIERDRNGRETVVSTRTTVRREGHPAPARHNFAPQAAPDAHMAFAEPPPAIRTMDNPEASGNERENLAIPKPAADQPAASRQSTGSNSQTKKRLASREKSPGESKKGESKSEQWGASGSSEAPAEMDSTEDESSLPYGVPVPEKDGLVYSPFSNDGYVDVKGMPSGSKARCPYSKKIFRVP
ncbi:MAG: hypothetical protein ACR2OZ_12450 [Verrucomicrobiales bacterium]